MPNENLTYCQLDVNQPANDTNESDFPSWLRQLKKALRNAFTSEHTCAGTHFFGVAGGTANALTVDIGDAYYLTVQGLYEGMTVRFKASIVNTGAVTFQLMSGASAVGIPVALQYLGLDLVAGDMIVGRYYEAIFDGTAFQLLTPPVRQAVLYSLFMSSDTLGSELINSTAETAITTVIVAANSFSNLIWDFHVYPRNATGNGRDATFKLYRDATVLKTFPQFNIVKSDGDNLRQMPRVLSFISAATAGTYTLKATLDAANSQYGMTGGIYRAWGK